jgi:hypothetical protein
VQVSAPIDLSLANEEYGKAHPRGNGSPVVEKVVVGRRGAAGVGSPVENADLLYEYFPLSLDDWWVSHPFSLVLFLFLGSWGWAGGK